jgi:hypothetical protein
MTNLFNIFIFNYNISKYRLWIKWLAHFVIALFKLSDFMSYEGEYITFHFIF